MSTAHSLVYLLAGLVSVFLFSAYRRRRVRYPPGPKGLPVLGNLFDVPVDYPWIGFCDIGKQHGSDVVHFQVLGTHLVVLNSLQAVGDLLEKQSNVYSDRPSTIMLDELSGWSRSWVQLDYGERWKEHRRLFHQNFRPSAIPQYHAKQAKAARRLLRFIVDSPERLVEHLRFIVGAMVLDTVFAFDVKPGDPMIKLVENAADTAIETIAAGVWMVDVIPALKYIPSWFPGARFQRKAREWKKQVDGLFDIPYGHFKESMRVGDAKPCFMSTLLSNVDDYEDLAQTEEMFASLAGVSYVAGSDTIVSTLATFVFAMTLFPEAQAAAHIALDDVLKGKRLPEIEDREALPYITALLYELLRWHPVTPIALPHRTSADSYYQGCFIPAGTNVFGNSWAILHDPTLYPEPHRFRPERFLRADGSLNPDARVPVEGFGFGRRICPGRHFAQDMLWITIAHVLAVFEIQPVGDASRKVDPEDVEQYFTPRFVSMPKPFECRFRLRVAEGLIPSGDLDQ
ncbi:cytochrome P450 [Phanerochaete sordida]|uniref:Cytochrome P450 n=1 Tax=Phanerochaete sordida TaxID=48140 RepID=A0A9P3GJW6_9APHY|nr:cytochrome P450 [Phanerochaete sordida]